MSVERFDIEKVIEKFENSLIEDDDVLLEEYLEAFEEIVKFLQLIGTVFGFVSSDVRVKIDILYDLRNHAEDIQNYISIKNMMAYEKENNLLKDNVSGSRTLLRLHRGLEFVYEFLSKLGELNENDKTYNCCKNAYNATLAKHHPWVIRKGAVVAMYTLPTRGELLKRVCVNVPQAIELLPEMLKHTRCVYDRMDKLYTCYELHNLP